MYFLYIFESFDIVDQIMAEIKCADGCDVSEAIDTSQLVVAEIEYLDVCDWQESIYV